MKDNELKLDETEASHTIGGSGEGRDHVRGNWRGRDYLDDNLYTEAFLKRKGKYLFFLHLFRCKNLTRENYLHTYKDLFFQ